MRIALSLAERASRGWLWKPLINCRENLVEQHEYPRGLSTRKFEETCYLRPLLTTSSFTGDLSYLMTSSVYHRSATPDWRWIIKQCPRQYRNDKDSICPREPPEWSCGLHSKLKGSNVGFLDTRITLGLSKIPDLPRVTLAIDAYLRQEVRWKYPNIDLVGKRIHLRTVG